MADNITALTQLRELLTELRAEIKDEATWTQQLGVLFAGMQATLERTNPAGRALVRLHAHETFRAEPEVQVAIDRMRTVRAQDATVDLSEADLLAGVELVENCLESLPDGDAANDAAYRRVLGHQVGAVIGFLEAMIDLGGWDPVVHAAREVVYDWTRTQGLNTWVALRAKPAAEAN